MHKPTIKLAEARDIVEDVAPKVKVIALADDQPLIVQRQLRAAIECGHREFLEHHRHFPFQEDGVTRLRHILDLHV